VAAHENTSLIRDDVKSGGDSLKSQVPNAFLFPGPAHDHDRKIAAIVRRVDVDKARMLAARCDQGIERLAERDVPPELKRGHGPSRASIPFLGMAGRFGVDVWNLDVVHHEQVLERAAAADGDVVAEVVGADDDVGSVISTVPSSPARTSTGSLTKGRPWECRISSR
jgi:hypothetical protein